MRSKTFPLVGWSLIIIGILHSLLGSSVGWQVLLDAAGVGLIGVWDAPPTRGRIFWFLVTEFALIVIGLLVAQLGRSGVAIPWSFIVFSGLLTLTGAVPMSASDFWLLLFPAAVYLVRRLRR